MNAMVAPALFTSMVTPWMPRMASLGPTVPPDHGSRSSRLEAISSTISPEGSSKRITSSSKRGSSSTMETLAVFSRSRQNANENAGTENDVATTCPLPLEPTRRP
jgi:hypothetical protein